MPLAALALMIWGCAGWPRSSTPLRAAPAGFVRLGEASAPRALFPGREMLRHERYLREQDTGGTSSIAITQYRGPIREHDVQAAHDVVVRRERLESFGPLEALTIDGRPAWAWFMVRASRRQAARTECVAVVSYDSCAYTVELGTADARLQDPALQLRIVASFSVPERQAQPGFEFFGLGLLAALGAALLLILTLPRGADE